MSASTPRGAWLLVPALLTALAGCAGEPKTESEDPSARPMATGRATPPLKPGDTLPPLDAPGWINGPPAAPNSPGVKLLVVDLWGRWCPHCRLSAPGLLRVYQRYADKGVAFVSMTNMQKEAVEYYVKENSAAWPNAYEISVGTIASLGASSGMIGPVEYEIAPTVYLVGPDGKIRWADGRGRQRHVDPAKWEADLDEAIGAALAGEGPKP
jgi:thiol-disulfide isomerase/thioredoxin